MDITKTGIDAKIHPGYDKCTVQDNQETSVKNEIVKRHEVVIVWVAQTVFFQISSTYIMSSIEFDPPIFQSSNFNFEFFALKL